MALALEGIKVIDVSQVVAVPMAARFLGDFGAFNPTLGSSPCAPSRSARKRWNARHADNIRARLRPESPRP